MENPDFIVPPPGLFLPTDSDDGDDESTAKVSPRAVIDGIPPAPVGTDAAPPTGPAAAVPALSIPAFVPTVLGAPPRTVLPGTALPATVMMDVVVPADPPAAAVWQLSLADGQNLTVTGSLVLGRDPAPATHRDATMARVTDPARSVSKSHALVELVDGELWVTDLHSTNGVSIDVHGQRTPLDPGVRTALAAGVSLSLGEFAVRVSRA